MSPTKLGAVVVGSGFIANRHAGALREAGIPVLGVYSRSERNAATAAARWGTHAFADIETLLDADGASHVHICTPTTNHQEMVSKGIQRGLAIVCEKPLTVDGESAALLARKAAAVGVENYVTFNRRYDQGIQLFRTLVQDGEIGEAVAVFGSYQQEWNAAPSSYDWRFDPDQVGPSRVISEIGSHWLDLATHVLVDDSITAVSALTKNMGERVYKQGQKTGTFTPVNEDLFASMLRFRNGAVGSVFATQLAQGAWDDILLRVDGTKGSLTWNSRSPGRVSLAHKGAGFDGTWQWRRLALGRRHDRVDLQR